MFHLKCLQYFHVHMLNYTIAKTLTVFTYVHVTCKIQLGVVEGVGAEIL